ncbi:hypothetical protein COW81_00665 [Candidatus Campbellbacteria bacterium CG22_combo_CG10-13_8_21_14_all_36_13]|uniref:IPT/TIG domain-containing protein n=1 Tax=Candidatus Campbellbacteria bacterium CG22_combo_CG10-13_8_21_14_all_36_13 TaxID=1974529 RepID=A0A2H0DYW7_9BACT|nr:MAG: hypothetical protein COW81_00665 [Candidatus Campbellbacteria bacterium CG22_combo_CG10-13_8_21_14_all_36_13]
MKYYTNIRKVSLSVFFIFIALGVVLYAYNQSKNFLSGPQIDIISPENNEKFNKPLITVRGVASNISKLKLNGRQIYIDENENFNEELLLQDGYNIITLHAYDKFKRETIETREVILIENPLNTTNLEFIKINIEENGNKENKSE